MQKTEENKTLFGNYANRMQTGLLRKNPASEVVGIKAAMQPIKASPSRAFTRRKMRILWPELRVGM